MTTSWSMETYTDPYELWAAAAATPTPTQCEATTKKNVRCSTMAQNNLRVCKRHWPASTPYPTPQFFVSGARGGIMVLEGEDYIHLNEAIIKLMIKKPIPVGYRIHHIDGTGDCYPDNLQLVPSEVLEEARRLYHPTGVPIRWVEENGVAKYSPTTVRLNPELLDFLDGEAARVGWSRAKVLEHYLLRGIEFGPKPESVAEILEGKKQATP